MGKFLSELCWFALNNFWGKAMTLITGTGILSWKVFETEAFKSFTPAIYYVTPVVMAILILSLMYLIRLFIDKTIKKTCCEFYYNNGQLKPHNRKNISDILMEKETINNVVCYHVTFVFNAKLRNPDFSIDDEQGVSFEILNTNINSSYVKVLITEKNKSNGSFKVNLNEQR